MDIEDSVPLADVTNSNKPLTGPLVTQKRKRSEDVVSNDGSKSWREELGPPPKFGKTKVSFYYELLL